MLPFFYQKKKSSTTLFSFSFILATHAPTFSLFLAFYSSRPHTFCFSSNKIPSSTRKDRYSRSGLFAVVTLFVDFFGANVADTIRVKARVEKRHRISHNIVRAVIQKTEISVFEFSLHMRCAQTLYGATAVFFDISSNSRSNSLVLNPRDCISPCSLKDNIATVFPSLIL